MDEVAIDVEQTGAVRLFVHQVIVPDFVVERAWLHGVNFCSERNGLRLASGIAGNQRPACTAAVSRPKNRHGSRAWSARTIR
jgi:hypothetical protein